MPVRRVSHRFSYEAPACILHLVAKPGKSLLKLKDNEALAPLNVPFQVHLLAQAMTRALQQEVLSAHDLTPLHWGILCCLWRTDGLRTTEIALCLDQLGGTITMGLDTMQKRELIIRTPDDVDRRILRVFLTKLGASLEAIVVPKAARLIERMLQHRSHSEYEAFLLDLLRIREGVNAILKPEEQPPSAPR